MSRLGRLPGRELTPACRAIFRHAPFSNRPVGFSTFFHRLAARSATKGLRAPGFLTGGLVTSGLLSIGLGGCVPATEMPDLMMSVPTSYSSGGPGKRRDLPAEEWWRSFRSRELAGFMEETAASNFDIAAATSRIIQADAAARVAGTALLPTLTASDTVTRSQYANITNTNVSSIKPRTVLVTNMQASYIIDIWGMNRAKLQAAIETANYNRWDHDTVSLTALSNTATTYLAVLGARERIYNQHENLKSATRILTIIQDRVKFGTANALDLAQQEALVANVRAAIPPLQLTSDQNRVALGLLLGRVPESIIIKSQRLTDVTMPKIAPGLPSEVLTQRPDVQSAEAQLASAHASVVAARAAFFPQIQLTGQGGFQSLALKTLFQPSSGLYSLSAGLTQPIFNAGLLSADYDQAKGRQEELLADYRKAIVSAFTDVEKALISIRDLSEQERLLGTSLIASQKALTLAEDQLRAGTVDYTTVLQAQQTLFNTRDTSAQVHLSLLQAAVTLYQALGGGWPQSQTTASQTLTNQAQKTEANRAGMATTKTAEADMHKTASSTDERMKTEAMGDKGR